MNGNCHFMVGLSVGIAASLITRANPASSTLLISTALLGSVFPDIDNPKSHIGQLTKPVSSFVALFGGNGYHHRGIMHNLILHFALCLLCCFKFVPLIGFFLGTLSHLFLDSLNPSGTPVLKHTYLHLGKIPSDSEICPLLCGAIFVGIIGISMYMYINNISFDLKLVETASVSTFETARIIGQ